MNIYPIENWYAFHFDSISDYLYTLNKDNKYKDDNTPSRRSTYRIIHPIKIHYGWSTYITMAFTKITFTSSWGQFSSVISRNSLPKPYIPKWTDRFRDVNLLTLYGHRPKCPWKWRATSFQGRGICDVTL